MAAILNFKMARNHTSLKYTNKICWPQIKIKRPWMGLDRSIDFFKTGYKCCPKVVQITLGSNYAKHYPGQRSGG